jgi:nucleotide-binding universal stress UspA family protein
MVKLLVPVDGSASSKRAIDYLMGSVAWYKEGLEIHLLNVQPPIPGGNRVASLVGHDRVKEYHHDEGMAALKPAMEKLDAVGVKYSHHIVVGEPGQTIAEFAKEKLCDQILMGTRGMDSTANLLLGSVATKVIHLADAPVLLVK